MGQVLLQSRAVLCYYKVGKSFCKSGDVCFYKVRQLDYKIGQILQSWIITTSGAVQLCDTSNLQRAQTFLEGWMFFEGS